MVEAGGIEPTVRRTRTESFSEGSRYFCFHPIGAYRQATIGLSRKISLMKSRDTLHKPARSGHAPTEAPGKLPSGRSCVIKQLKRSFRWQLSFPTIFNEVRWGPRLATFGPSLPRRTLYAPRLITSSKSLFNFSCCIPFCHLFPLVVNLFTFG